MGPLTQRTHDTKRTVRSGLELRCGQEDWELAVKHCHPQLLTQKSGDLRVSSFTDLTLHCLLDLRNVLPESPAKLFPAAYLS